VANNVFESANKIMLSQDRDELGNHIRVYKNYLRQFSQIINTVKDTLSSEHIDLIKKVSKINDSVQAKLTDEKNNIALEIKSKKQKKKILKSYNPYYSNDNNFSKDA
jgi:succinylglutamate desuccinylase